MREVSFYSFKPTPSARLNSGVEAVEKPLSERQNDPPRWRISRFIVVNGGVDFSVFADASIFAHDRAA